jgi:hypothetical protein
MIITNAAIKEIKGTHPLSKVYGYMRRKLILFPFDTSATHNFISQKTLRKLHIQPHTSKNVAIKLATGKVETNSHQLSNYPIKLGAFLYNVTFTVIELSDHEAMLGMQWMHNTWVLINCYFLTIKMWTERMQKSQTIHIAHTTQVSSANVLLSAMQIKCLVQKTKSPSGVIFLLNKLDMDKDPNLPQEVIDLLDEFKILFPKSVTSITRN